MPLSLCIACGPRGLADALLNLVLFLPLGFALAGIVRKLPALLLGSLLSLVIEVAQLGIPGRDSSLSDLLFNTVGTAVGVLIWAKRDLLLARNSRACAMLTAAGLILTTVVMLATAWLLQPVGAVSIARVGDDLLLRFTSRASTYGLDQPEYWSRGAFRGHDRWSESNLFVSRDDGHWRIMTPTGDAAIVGPTVGQGWALLAYPDEIARGAGQIPNAIWLFILFLPIGFVARNRIVLAGAAAAATAVLVLLPVATGLLPTTMAEWGGSAAGLLTGMGLDFAFFRPAH